ncbi:hypothetical protein BJX66DRAFT_318626 [Aspergillus keveii]|uniref:Uncharacterized protein n=1 Tax=Aspergillus keveii TaxID=714993 RepID=A0ABR4FJF3_9EURO
MDPSFSYPYLHPRLPFLHGDNLPSHWCPPRLQGKHMAHLPCISRFIWMPRVLKVVSSFLCALIFRACTIYTHFATCPPQLKKCASTWFVDFVFHFLRISIIPVVGTAGGPNSAMHITGEVERPSKRILHVLIRSVHLDFITTFPADIINLCCDTN